MSRLSILENRLGLSGGIGGGGGENPKEEPKKSLSYDQINKWSGFVEGNPSLRGMDAMWSAFSTKYPNSGIDRSVLTENLDRLMAKMQDRGKAWGYDRPDLLNTGMAFPMVYYNNTGYGRMDANGRTEVPVPQPAVQYPQKFIQNKIPDDVKDIWYDEQKGLWAYDDPHEGVVKFASKEAANTPKVRELVKTIHDQQAPKKP